MKEIIFLFIPIAMLISCNQNRPSVSKASPDAAFQKLTDDYLAGYFAWRPNIGVASGYHEYDGMITDLSKQSIANELARLKKFGHALAITDTASLSPKMFYNFRILRSAIQQEIFTFEDMGAYSRDPITYASSVAEWGGAVDVSIYVKRNFAPIEDRLRSIIKVEKNIPKIMAEAKANLADSLPRPYIETAINIAQGSVSFLKNDLKTGLKDVKNDSLMSAFAGTNKIAIDAMTDFADYLKKEKSPKAKDNYAIGKASYARMLYFSEGITLSPEKILAIGLKELAKEKIAFSQAAKIINPNKSAVAVFQDLNNEHPTAESLIPDGQKDLEKIRQFIIEKDLVTIPSSIRIKVEETPGATRSWTTASDDNPGPFETKATEAFYYVTPVDPTWTAKQKDDWLRRFSYFYYDNISIHEAYPGHYVQYLHLNVSSATKVEKLFGSESFIEGWAHYCEQMMADEEYGADGDKVKAAKYRMAQSADALLRLSRLCVSIKMHCYGMKLDEATKFFMDNWYAGEKPSEQEAIRGTFDPYYLFYTIGKLEILKLRDEYKKQEGANYSLKKFHDEFLAHGMPQIRMLREIMLKDKNTWNDVL